MAPLIVWESVPKTDRLAEADWKLLKDRKRWRLGLRVTDRLPASLWAVISPTDVQIAVHSSSLSLQSAQEDVLNSQNVCECKSKTKCWYWKNMQNLGLLKSQLPVMIRCVANYGMVNVKEKDMFCIQ